MLNMRINTKKIWYSLFEEGVEEVDENGDYTGNKISRYGKVRTTRANLSAARGTMENDIFGANLSYSKTMSTANMKLGIDERTLLWDEKPETERDGTPTDTDSAKYRVAAIARGHYQVHYALRQMNLNVEEEY